MTPAEGRRSDGAPAVALPHVAVPPGRSPVGTLAWLGAAIVALYFGREILIPIALAGLLAFALEPVATKLRRWGLGRTGSVVIVVALAFVMISGFGALVATRAMQLAANLPTYQYNIQQKIRALHGASPEGGVIDRTSTALQEIGDEITGAKNGAKARGDVADPASKEPVPVRVESAPQAPLSLLSDIAGPILGPLAAAGLVLIFLVFLLLEREEIRDRFIKLVGGRDMNMTTQALGEAADRVSRYLLMQLVVNASYGIPIGLGLYFIGVPNAALWGVLAAVLRFIPYVGAFIAAAFPLALAIAVDPGWSMVLWTIGLFLLVELVSNNVVEPWLYGASTGLSAVAIIVAAIFWTTLWGPAGLLLSTPLTVCLAVLGRYVPQLQFLYVMLGNAPAMTLAERFYQRMLAGDIEEGIEIVEAYGANDDVAKLHDDVVLPALRLAEADRRRDALSADAVDAVASNVREVLESIDFEVAAAAAGGAATAVRWTGTPVLCAGRTQLDRAAAALLAQRLARIGIGAEVLATDSLTPERIARFEAEGVRVVVTTHLGGSGVAHAQQLCRKLRKRAPVKMLIALLNAQLPGPVGTEQLATLCADDLALSLEAAVRWIDELAREPIETPMIAAPTPEVEAERLLALEHLGLLDTPQDAKFDAVTQRLRDTLAMPIALVSLIDKDRQFWKSACGLPDELAARREAPRETSVCGHVVAKNDLLVVEDMLKDPRFANNPFLLQHGIRFYAGAPLRTSEGYAVGSLCVMDTKPRHLAKSQRRILQDAAVHLMQDVEKSATLPAAKELEHAAA